VDGKSNLKLPPCHFCYGCSISSSGDVGCDRQPTASHKFGASLGGSMLLGGIREAQPTSRRLLEWPGLRFFPGLSIAITRQWKRGIIGLKPGQVRDCARESIPPLHRQSQRLGLTTIVMVKRQLWNQTTTQVRFTSVVFRRMTIQPGDSV